MPVSAGLYRYLIWLVVLFCAYVVTAHIGLRWATVAGAVSPVFPAAGVALAGLVLGGLRLWPAIVLGRLVTFWMQGDSAYPFWLELTVSGGNALAAVAGAYGLLRWGRLDLSFRRLRDVVWFVLWGAVASSMVAATIGAGSIGWYRQLGMEGIALSWATWWAGNLAGTLVMAPLLLSWLRTDPLPARTRYWLHLAGCLLLTGTLAWLTFLTDVSALLRPWLLFPLLIWAAIAFQVRGAAAAMLVTGVFAVLGTGTGVGPFAEYFFPGNLRLVILAQFLSLLAVTAYVLAAIADERRIHQALRRSEEHARRIIDNTLFLVGVLTPDGTLTEANATALRAGGLTRQEVIGRKFWDCYWWSYDPLVQAECQRAVARAASGEVVRYDVTVRMAGDSRMPIDFVLSPARDASGRITHLIPSGVDIAVRKRAEQALRERDQQLRLILAAAELGTWRFSLDSSRWELDERAQALYGLDAVTRHDDAMIARSMHRDDIGPMWQCVREACDPDGDGHYECEYRVRTAEGGWRWLRAWGQVEFEGERPQRRAVRMIGCTRDVTESKQAEAAMRQAREEAERASAAKSEFLATLSHELRTPLTPVLLTVSLLENHPALSDELREDVATIRRNVELESQLISDLLDLTRIEKGKLHLDQQEVDLHRVIRSAIETCRPSESVLPPGAVLRESSPRLVVDLKARRHFVRGDSTRLQQVFWNLLSNAQKFTPADGRITVRSSNGSDGQILVEVSDTGIGIDPQKLPVLFAPFEQGEGRSGRPQAGLGLGLAISRRLVEAHGGTLDAASDGKGQGATFSVRLPAIARTAEDQASRRSPPVEVASKPLSVLLVEDHEPTLSVMTRLLHGLGHRVIGATSLATATAAATAEHFDLVISDLGLPDGSGLDLIRLLKQGCAGRAIALTGYGMDSDIAASRAAGFCEHLTKPVDLAALAAAIQRVTVNTTGERSSKFQIPGSKQISNSKTQMEGPSV